MNIDKVQKEHSRPLHITLPSLFFNYVTEQVEKGYVASRSEVIRQALLLHMEEWGKIKEIKKL